MEPRGLFIALPAQRLHILWVQEDPLDLEVVGRCGGEDTPVHGTGLIDWHILPTSLSPETIHPRHSACLGFRDVTAAQVTKA